MKLEDEYNAEKEVKLMSEDDKEKDSVIGTGKAGFSRISLQRLCWNALPEGYQISRDTPVRLAHLLDQEVAEIIRMGIWGKKHRVMTLDPEDLERGLEVYRKKWALKNLAPTIESLERIKQVVENLKYEIGDEDGK